MSDSREEPDTPSEIQPRLIGAPREYNELQALAQQANMSVPAPQTTVVFELRDVVGEWQRDPTAPSAPEGACPYQWMGTRHG